MHLRSDWNGPNIIYVFALRKNYHALKSLRKESMERNNLLPSSLLNFALVLLELLTTSGYATGGLGGKGGTNSWKGKWVTRRQRGRRGRRGDRKF